MLPYTFGYGVVLNYLSKPQGISCEFHRHTFVGNPDFILTIATFSGMVKHFISIFTWFEFFSQCIAFGYWFLGYRLWVTSLFVVFQ